MATKGGDTVTVERLKIGCWNINGTGPADDRKKVISYNLQKKKTFFQKVLDSMFCFFKRYL